MLKGFNSDINIRGQSYHIQTEDWGDANPFLVSRIFLNGAVLKTIKTSYVEAFKSGPIGDREALQQALKKQHYKVVDELFQKPSAPDPTFS